MRFRQLRRFTSLISFVAVFALVCLPLLANPRPADAAPTVNSLADNGPGNCATACTLRDAIATASVGDTITFSVTGIIALASGTLVIDKNLTINGSNPSTITIDG